MIGKDYSKIINRDKLLCCSISRVDVIAAKDIFGPNLEWFKGKPHSRRVVTSGLMFPTAKLSVGITWAQKNLVDEQDNHEDFAQ